MDKHKVMYNYCNKRIHVTANNTGHKKTHFTLTEDKVL